MPLKKQESPKTDRPEAPLDNMPLQAYIYTYMGQMRRLAFFISKDLDDGLEALKKEHGTPEAESIRRALTAYLTEKGVLGKQKPNMKSKPRKESS